MLRLASSGATNSGATKHRTVRRMTKRLRNYLIQRGGSMSESGSLDKNSAIDDLRRVNESTDGESVSWREYEKMGEYSPDQLYRLFGSWMDALSASDIEPTKLQQMKSEHQRRSYDTDDVIGDFKSVVEEIGEVPTAHEYNEKGQFTHTTLCRHLDEDTYRDAVEKMGYKSRAYKLPPKDELINEIRSLAVEIGDPPTRREYEKFGSFSSSAVAERFGGWNSTLRSAGLPANQNVGPIDVILDVANVSAQIGEEPTLEQYEEHGKFSYRMIIERTGMKFSDISDKGYSMFEDNPELFSGE